MLDLNEINEEISRLEHSGTTYSICEKLSVLYIVRNYCLSKGEKEQPVARYSYADSPMSEFARAVTKVSFEKALPVLEEHMEAVRIIYPKEYQMVLDRLTALK